MPGEARPCRRRTRASTSPTASSSAARPRLNGPRPDADHVVALHRSHTTSAARLSGSSSSALHLAAERAAEREHARVADVGLAHARGPRRRLDELADERARAAPVPTSALVRPACGSRGRRGARRSARPAGPRPPGRSPRRRTVAVGVRDPRLEVRQRACSARYAPTSAELGPTTGRRAARSSSRATSARWRSGRPATSSITAAAGSGSSRRRTASAMSPTSSSMSCRRVRRLALHGQRRRRRAGDRAACAGSGRRGLRSRSSSVAQVAQQHALVDRRRPRRARRSRRARC